MNYRSYIPIHTIEPHERYATGILIDNSTVGGALLVNRGIMGSGQGWAALNSLLWNIRASKIKVQTPPLGYNLCVGCQTIPMASGSYSSSNLYSTPDPNPGSSDNYLTPGAFHSTSQQITPASLFTTQLRNRLGASLAAQILNQPTIEPRLSISTFDFLSPTATGEPIRFVLQKVKKCGVLQKRSTSTLLFSSSAPRSQVSSR